MHYHLVDKSKQTVYYLGRICIYQNGGKRCRQNMLSYRNAMRHAEA